MPDIRRAAALVALLGAAGPSPAAAQGVEAWRWPGEAAPTCVASAPDSVMEVYMAGAPELAGRHVIRRCRADAADSPAAIVTSSFRFAKRLALLPTMDIAVDHRWIEWRRDGRLVRVLAQARGSGACGGLTFGECDFELTIGEGGAGGLIRRTDENGTRVTAIAADALNKTLWNPETVAARTVVDVYTGRVWTMRGDVAGVPDPVAGRAARRHHVKGESQGFAVFASRYERVLWFDPPGEILRVCDFHADFGIDNVAEFVRADLGVGPGHDCARWFD